MDDVRTVVFRTKDARALRNLCAGFPWQIAIDTTLSTDDGPGRRKAAVAHVLPPSARKRAPCFGTGNAVLISVVNYAVGRFGTAVREVSCKSPVFWPSSEAPFGTPPSRKVPRCFSGKNYPRRFRAG